MDAHSLLDRLNPRSYRRRVTNSFRYAAARTPFGRFDGALADVRPDDLAETALPGVVSVLENMA